VAALDSRLAVSLEKLYGYLPGAGADGVPAGP